jgi:hypothetical protein
MFFHKLVRGLARGESILVRTWGDLGANLRMIWAGVFEELRALLHWLVFRGQKQLLDSFPDLSLHLVPPRA